MIFKLAIRNILGAAYACQSTVTAHGIVRLRRRGES
jgi:hypothetical protein